MNRPFIHDDFMLDSDPARTLYHEYAEKLPIYDYHCHLPPADIAADKQYENMTQLWLYGDHYKWRAMRTHGVEEKYCTGPASDEEKFFKWADTLGHCLRNPLYHWSHLELKRYFDIDDLLSPATAQKIYRQCNEKLNTPEYSTRGLMRKMNVHAVCTTDDPTDSLAHHQKLIDDGFEIEVKPGWRLNHILLPHQPAVLNEWVDKLQAAADVSITDYKSLSDALKKRHDFFHDKGCRTSDISLPHAYDEDASDKEIADIFKKLRAGKEINEHQKAQFITAVLQTTFEWNCEKNWVQQMHLGPLRNNNSKMFKTLGPDIGFDSIDDLPQAQPLAKFLDRLESKDKLAKTILYCLNPKDMDVLAGMLGNFQKAPTPGKLQLGPGWWFLDQKAGMTQQIESMSNLSLLSHFVGMLTDSRSFLSYPRHEYFRRLLCNILGGEMEKGLLPNDMNRIGQMVSNICFHNAKNYFSGQ